jgi:Uncharacterized conserved protein (DUF2358)
MCAVQHRRMIHLYPMSTVNHSDSRRSYRRRMNVGPWTSRYTTGNQTMLQILLLITIAMNTNSRGHLFLSSYVECYVTVQPFISNGIRPSSKKGMMMFPCDEQQPRRRQQQLFLTAPHVPAESATTAVSAVATNVQGNRDYDILLSPWEQWCIQQLQVRYDQALSIKCPFFRRRAADVLDAIDMVIQFIWIRHKSLPTYTMILPSIYGNSAAQQNDSGRRSSKCIDITPTELLSVLRDDWKTSTNKGYYVTGKLTTAVYSDHVLFDGPDPDMPVRGLYKYMNAASQLFDVKSSYSELLSLYIQDEATIVARWKMYGRLRLPWKPVVPEWTGTTTYHINPNNGLIDQHIETWDISVWQAFLQTLCPQVARQIWR